jgi:hypothetical protein
MKPSCFIGIQPEGAVLPFAFSDELRFALPILNSKRTTFGGGRPAAEQEILRQSDRVFWLFVGGCVTVGVLVLLAITSRGSFF